MHTKDIGIAIRDSLNLLVSVETMDWESDDCDETGSVQIYDVDASDADNLKIVMEDGSAFRVSIVRER